jgi:DNA-binding LacI/PurR family transcriptional regulator
MSTLKDIANRSGVSILTAYYVLNRDQPSPQPITEQSRQAVLTTAALLGYDFKVTIHDVAALAGVSTATVSYAMNAKETVSKITRDKVLWAATALGYRPSSNARGLKMRKTGLLGYAWHSVLSGEINAFLDHFTYRMAQIAEANGYHLLMFVQQPDDPIIAYRQLLQAKRVDGFLLADTNHNDARIRFLMDSGVPFTAFGRANNQWDFPYVDIDGQAGITLAVRHLRECGHSRIAVLAWPEGSLSGDTRLQGYYEAMRGLEIAPELVLRTLNTRLYARAAAAQLLRLPPRQRPTAIVCLSDKMAVGVIDQLFDSGVRVGYDISVTGFDDEPIAGMLKPALTSLRQPVEAIANTVMDLLLAELEGSPLTDRHILLPPSLVIRDSTSLYSPP